MQKTGPHFSTSPTTGATKHDPLAQACLGETQTPLVTLDIRYGGGCSSPFVLLLNSAAILHHSAKKMRFRMHSSSVGVGFEVTCELVQFAVGQYSR